MEEEQKTTLELKKKAESDIAMILEKFYKDTGLKPTYFNFDYEESNGGGYWIVSPVISLR